MVQSHGTIFIWQSTISETSHAFEECFALIKIALIYAKILQSTEMLRLLQKWIWKTSAQLPGIAYEKFFNKTCLDIDIFTAVASYNHRQNIWHKR